MNLNINFRKKCEEGDTKIKVHRKRITVTKTLALPLLNHILMSVPNPPEL